MTNKQQIPTNINVLLSLVFILANLWVLILLPLFVIDHSPQWALTLIPIAFFTTTFWSLIHESFHSLLHPNKKINNVIGRSMCMLFGAPFSILRFGHLLHHRVNRSIIDRSEIFTTGNRKKGLVLTLYHYNLLIGLYLAEFFSNLLILLPVKWIEKLMKPRLLASSDHKNILQQTRKQLLSGKHLWLNRLESILILILFTSSFVAYNTYAWYLCLFLVMRGIAISYWDNAFHYGTEINNKDAAFNLSLPTWYAKSILNFNYHQIHHRYPYLPWPELPRAFIQDGGHYDGKYWPISLRQLNGPIYIQSSLK